MTRKEDFIVVLRTSTYMQGLFPHLQMISGALDSGEDVTPTVAASVGVRLSSKRVGTDAQRLLSAVSPGGDGMIWMDSYIEKHGGTLNPAKDYLRAVDAWLDEEQTQELVRM